MKQNEASILFTYASQAPPAPTVQRPIQPPLKLFQPSSKAVEFPFKSPRISVRVLVGPLVHPLVNQLVHSSKLLRKGYS